MPFFLAYTLKKEGRRPMMKFYSGLFKGKSRDFILSLSLLFVALSQVTVPQNALATSQWSTQPSWASNNSGSEPKRKTASDTNLFPFAPGSNNLALDVGQVFLMGDLGSNYSDAIGSQLHYTYGVSEMFGFDASLSSSSHSDGKFSMTTALMGLRTNLAWYDKVVPYVNFGLGFYKPSYQLTPTNSVAPVVFGVHLGPGINLELTKHLFFGADLTFHDIFGTTKVVAVTQYTPDGTLNIGGTYTTFFLHAGVTF